jgi:hypothetical protein
MNVKSTQSIMVVLGEAVSANQLAVAVSYEDDNATTIAATAFDSYTVFTNNTTPVAAISSPSVGTVRRPKNIGINNCDTVSHTVEVYELDGVTVVPLVKLILLPNSTLEWKPSHSWTVLPSGTGYSYQGKTSTSSTPYAVVSNDVIIYVDSSGGNKVVNLPAASGGGRLLTIKSIGSGGYTVTVTPNGADTIDGAVSFAMYDSECITIQDEASGAWYSCAF